ncbi:MAG: hypothetical protein IJQ97_06425 [Paludibacteraceae bacterium]|nr:hypothetical protein [Paludibacteraceae bacterium]
MKRILLYSLLLAALSLQAQDLLPWPTDTIDGKVYYRYTVEKSIGLYRISKNFGVSQESILQANPALRTRGLRYEEVILIPTNLPATPKVVEQPVTRKAAEQSAMPKVIEHPVAPKVIEETATPTVAEHPLSPKEATVSKPLVIERLLSVETDTVEWQDSTSAMMTDSMASEADSGQVMQYTDTVRLVYLLPLHADQAQRNPTIDRFYDFYAGALLALKHQEPSQTDSPDTIRTTYYDVRTYDVGKTVDVISQLVDSNRLADADAIIGPAYMKQLETLSGYAREHEIPVLIPFLPSVPEVNNNPYLLKFNPSDEIQTHAMMDYLDSVRSAINIVLVDAYARSADYSPGIRILRDSIQSRRLPCTHTTIRQILADSIGPALKDSVENILLFHSERYSNVQLLMPYLLSGKRDKRLTLLSQYAWMGEHVLLPQLYASVFRITESEALAKYESDFAHYFGHKLSSVQPRYDLLGYDLTQYILQILRSGTHDSLPTRYEGLQSTIHFGKIENGGYENTHIDIQKR